MSEHIYEDSNMEHERYHVIPFGSMREEIVRCRDCIYYKQDPDPIDPGWPMMCERTGDDMVEPYGYCAWGERRERESAEVWNQWSADDVTCSEES